MEFWLEAADEILAELPTYMGQAFEDICIQFLKRQAKAKKLPFIPAEMGKWWGSNPRTGRRRHSSL